jgi:hypothetical protein
MAASQSEAHFIEPMLLLRTEKLPALPGENAPTPAPDPQPLMRRRPRRPRAPDEPGTALGTVAYMSPKQARGELALARTCSALARCYMRWSRGGRRSKTADFTESAGSPATTNALPILIRGYSEQLIIPSRGAAI